MAFSKREYDYLRRRQMAGRGTDTPDIVSIPIKHIMTTYAKLFPNLSEFIFAATDTTSNALARTLHLLSEHQDVQDKLRGELQDASHDDAVIPHDRLVELPYLDAVCRETLRL